MRIKGKKKHFFLGFEKGVQEPMETRDEILFQEKEINLKRI